MFVIEVIPLVRGVHIESLSYFSATNYTEGSFLKVPVRGRQVPAVVIHTHPVSNAKTSLKAATFSLRKLPEQKAMGSLPEPILATARELSKEIPAKTGALLYHFLPPDIRSGSFSYPTTPFQKNNEETTPQMLQGGNKERFVEYKSHIRTTFAHRGSVLFVVPTTNDVLYAKSMLDTGIADRIVLFHSAQTKKQRTESYEEFSDLSTAKLIITTPSHAYLDRTDLLTIIVEAAGSKHYCSRTRPYLDHRDALKHYAKAAGRSIILGDLVLRTEDEYYRREDKYLTLGEHAKRIAFPSPMTVIKQSNKRTLETPFTLFSDETIKNIKTTLEGRGSVLLYTARRGLAPVVACYDCGHIFRCPDSHTPYSLMRTHKNGKEQRWFISRTSGKRVEAADVCSECGSWRLRERGIGIQYIEDEFKTLFPDTKQIIFDHTTATTHKKALDLTDKFYNEKGSVMIATPMCLQYLNKPIDISVITSLDATRAIPSWRADEELFSTLMRLRELSSKNLIIQTRSDVDDLMIYASRGALERFYDDELSLRKMIKYPPYSVFILLTWQGNHMSVTKTEESVHAAVIQYQPHFYSDPASTSKKTIRHCLIRFKKTDWPHEECLNTLKRLPPHIAIKINPDRIV